MVLGTESGVKFAQQWTKYVISSWTIYTTVLFGYLRLIKHAAGGQLLPVLVYLLLLHKWSRKQTFKIDNQPPAVRIRLVREW